MESNIRRLARVELLSMENRGQVGAGTVVEFIPRPRRRLPRPRRARYGDQIVSFDVCGDSLEGDGIFDGDILVCKTNFEVADLTPGRLVVARLPSGGLVVKHLHTNNGHVVLKAANAHYVDHVFEREDVRIEAVVVESIRQWS
jgi:SOS-response transcriptional repressor LexA